MEDIRNIKIPRMSEGGGVAPHHPHHDCGGKFAETLPSDIKGLITQAMSRLEEAKRLVGKTIVDVKQTQKSSISSGLNVIQFVANDGSVIDFEVRNGEQGLPGKDANIAGANDAANRALEAANVAVNMADAVADINRSMNEAEAARAAAEEARVVAEQNRKYAFDDKEEDFDEMVSSLNGMFWKARQMLSVEEARVSAESARASAETERVSAESNRTSAESARVAAETSRNSAEQARISNEATRQNKETDRQSAEATRQINEAARQSNEATRQSNAESQLSQQDAIFASKEAERDAAVAAVANVADDVNNLSDRMDDLEETRDMADNMNGVWFPNPTFVPVAVSLSSGTISYGESGATSLSNVAVFFEGSGSPYDGLIGVSVKSGYMFTLYASNSEDSGWKKVASCQQTYKATGETYAYYMALVKKLNSQQITESEAENLVAVKYGDRIEVQESLSSEDTSTTTPVSAKGIVDYVAEQNKQLTSSVNDLALQILGSHNVVSYKEDAEIEDVEEAAIARAVAAATAAEKVDAKIVGNNLVVTKRDGTTTTINVKGADGTNYTITSADYDAIADIVAAKFTDVSINGQ